MLRQLCHTRMSVLPARFADQCSEFRRCSPLNGASLTCTRKIGDWGRSQSCLLYTQPCNFCFFARQIGSKMREYSWSVGSLYPIAIVSTSECIAQYLAVWLHRHRGGGGHPEHQRGVPGAADLQRGPRPVRHDHLPYPEGRPPHRLRPVPAAHCAPGEHIPLPALVMSSTCRAHLLDRSNI